MSFLIDTDICSAHLRQVAPVVSRVLQYSGHLFVSALSVGELYTWTLRRNAPRRYSQILHGFLSDVAILDVDRDVARMFGRVRAESFDRGKPIAAFDMMIAATALAHDLTLVTHNARHFAAVPGLGVVDWMKD
jgi:predicted nucleic acid-binding protein